VQNVWILKQSTISLHQQLSNHTLKIKFTMTTITIEAGKGLQSTLIEILKPIKTRISEGSDRYRATFELIGVINDPIQKLKDYGKGVFECLNIISID